MNIALTANLDALHLRLARAERLSSEARQALSSGNQNLAIGILFELQDLLPECDTLFRMILMLDRSRIGSAS